MNSETFLVFVLDIISFYAAYLIVVISLNLQYGYSGIPNFGLAFSVAGGAYVTGALTGRIAMWYYGIDSGLDFIDDNSFVTDMINEHLAKDPKGAMLIFFLMLLICIGANALLGFIAAYPAIRLRADYLMMTLIAMAEGIRVIGVNYKRLVGATFWIHVPDLFAWLGEYRRLVVTLTALGFSFMVLFLVHLIVNSPAGRLIKAMRENELTAESVGKDITRLRMKIVVLGAVLASFAGFWWSILNGVVLSAAYTRNDWTFWPWLMLMIGGRGNNFGSAVGTGAVILLRRFIIYYKHSLEQYIPFSVIWLERILLGTALIIIITFRPEGLIPERPIIVRGIKNYRRFLDKIKGKKGKDSNG